MRNRSAINHKYAAKDLRPQIRPIIRTSHVPTWHAGRRVVIGQGRLPDGAVTPPLPIGLYPRTRRGIPVQNREGAPAGPQSAYPARKRARWEGNFLPAARRCAHSSRTAGRQRLPAPHAGACRCSRLCPFGALVSDAARVALAPGPAQGASRGPRTQQRKPRVSTPFSLRFDNEWMNH